MHLDLYLKCFIADTSSGNVICELNKASGKYETIRF
jgi:hypothetical protein